MRGFLMAAVVALGPVFLRAAAPVLTGVDVGSPGRAGSMTVAGGKIVIVGGGNDIWSSSDNFHYAYFRISGDFDYIVNLESFAGNAGDGGWSKAELMARLEQSAGSGPQGGDPFLANMTTRPASDTANGAPAGTNLRAPQWRVTRNAYADWLAPHPSQTPNLPNNWMRLERVANVFYLYWSDDGIHWAPYKPYDPQGFDTAGMYPPGEDNKSAFTQAWPSTVLLGLAVTAHSDGDTSTAVFSNFGPWTPVPIAITKQPPAALVVPANNAIVLSVEATGDPVHYQWRKNGSVIPRAVSPTFKIDVVKESDSGAYAVRVFGGGREVISETAVVTVMQDSTPPTVTKASGDVLSTAVIVEFSEPVTDTALNPENYTLDHGVSVNSVTRLNARKVKLTTTKLAEGTDYTLTVNNVKDTATPANTIAPNTTASFRSWVFTLGACVQKYWENISPSYIASLTGDPRFPDAPTMTTLEPLFEYGPNGSNESGGNYGNQMQAWFVPAQTGNYVFFICSDDQSNLYLSTDEDPRNRRLIAQETGWSNPRMWASAMGGDRTTKRSDQFSGTEWPSRNTITLQAGRRYYLEALHVEGGGGDNLGVTFIMAGAADPVEGSAPALGGSVLGVYLDGASRPLSITQHPASLALPPGQTATFTVVAAGSEPLSYQWRKEGVNLVDDSQINGATTATLTIRDLQFANGGSYSVIVTSAGNSVASAPAILTVISDSAVVAWGAGTKNDGTMMNWGQSLVPPWLDNVVAISAGRFHSLALRGDGSVVSWGWNAYGQTNVPPGLQNVTAVAAGAFHSLALKADGTVTGWGDGDAAAVPGGLAEVIAIAAGDRTSLALRRDGTVLAWGARGAQEDHGQFDVPPGLVGVAAIAAGAYHCLALKQDGTVVAWGDNRYAQSSVPSGLNGVVSVTAGHYYSLALLSDGRVVGWGEVSIAGGLAGVVALSAGGYHVLALKSDGTVVAWGSNTYGEVNVPAGLSSVIAVAGSDNNFSLALRVSPNRSPMLLPQPATSIVLKPDQTARLWVRAVLATSYQWYRDGAALLSGTTATYTIPSATLSDAGQYSVVVANGAGSVTSLVASVAVNCSLVIQPGAGGSVTRVPSLDSYPFNSTVTLTAQPASGYRFTGWGGDLSGTSSPVMITMTTNRVVSATFTRLWTLTTTATAGGSLTRDPDLSEYLDGSTVTLTAIPKEHFTFAGWRGTLSGTNNPVTVMMKGNQSITADFVSGFVWVYVDGVQLVNTPFSWPPGQEHVQISMLSIFPGGSVFYTLDGSAPTRSSTPYTGPFNLTNAATIRAIAYSSDSLYSAEGGPFEIQTVPPPAPGTKLWESVPGGPLYGAPALGLDGTVYIGSPSKLYAINGATGGKLWEFPASNFVYGVTVGDDGTLYLASSGVLYAVDPATHSEKWRFLADGPVWGPPALGWDGTVYAAFHNRLYALDGATGGKRWEFAAGDRFQYPPSLGSDGTVYATSYDYRVYALDGQSGAQRWAFTAGSILPSAAAIGPDGTVYASSADKNLYALDGVTGARRWELATGNSWTGSTPTIGVDGTVYACNHANLYALDGATGAKRWEFTGPATMFSLAVGADETVYVGSDQPDSKLYALDGATGAKRWAFQFGDYMGGPPTIGPDGTLYANCYNQKLYAIATGLRAGPALGAWPMFGQNPQHTGRARRLAPSLRSQPLAQTAVMGTDAILSVSVSGTAPFSYQWFRDGSAIAGAVQPTLTLANLKAGDAGPYFVVVTNMLGSITSEVATVTVRCTLTVSGGVGGSVTRTPNADGYLPESEVTLTATAANGYRFTGWGGDMSGANNPATVTMNTNKVVTASFTAVWTLTTPAAAGGAVSRDPDLSEYLDGATVSLTAVPDANHAFSGWTGGAAGTDNPLTVTMNGNKTITANFLATYTLATAVTGEGAVAVVPLRPRYMAGESVQVTANPGAGFGFDRWSGASTATTPTIALTMDGDKVVTANFKRLRSLSVSTVGQGSVARSPDAPSYLDGTVVQLTATAANGWQFVGWQDALSGSQNPGSITLDADRTVQAMFRRLFKVTTSTVGGGSITLTPQQESYVEGTTITANAVANLGYRFTGWSGALGGTSNPASLLVDGDKNLTATFVSVWSLTTSATAGGSVLREPDLSDYLNGSTVRLTAVPNNGYAFAGWSGAAGGTDNPIVLTMDSHKAVMASFQDGSAPAVLITAPAAGPTADERISLRGTVTDNSGVTAVQWWRDGQAQGVLVLAGNQFEVSGLRLKRGANQFRVVARDAVGNEGAGEVAVTWAPPRTVAVVDAPEVREGKKVTLPVALVSSGDVGGMSLVLGYDPEHLKDPWWEWGALVGASVNAVNTNAAGEVRATFSLAGSAIAAGTQLLASVTFRARSVPFALEAVVEPETVDITDAAGSRLVFGTDLQAGRARILPRRLSGDNNGNDRLDIGDATLIQRLLTHLEPVRIWDVTNNDLNQTGDLDSGDVTKVLRVVVGLDAAPGMGAAALTPGAERSERVKEVGGQRSEVGDQKSELGDQEAGVRGQVSGAGESALLVPAELRGKGGDMVKLQVVLTNIQGRFAGVFFRLDYPTNALRLLNAAAHTNGPVVPSGAALIWNVAPEATNYLTQTGRVSFAASSAAPWPQANGLLAELTFQVQAGAGAQARWLIRLSGVEITVDGFENRSLPVVEAGFVPTVAVPLQFDRNQIVMTKEGLTLGFRGSAGVSYVLDMSEDLEAWRTLQRVVAVEGQTVVVDPGALGKHQRYYRLRLAP